MLGQRSLVRTPTGLLAAILAGLLVLLLSGVPSETVRDGLRSGFAPVAPFVPDALYLPVQYRGLPNAKRHPKGWTRHMDLKGPLIRDLTGMEIEELPPYQSCEVMIAAVSELGMNGAAERFATEDGHALGQVFAHFAIEQRADIKALFRNAMMLGMRGQEISYDSARPTRFGEGHGVTVRWLGEYAYNLTLGPPDDSTLFDWALLVDTVCAADDKNDYRQLHFCMHGVGHAFHYMNIYFPRAPATICLPEPTRSCGEPECHAGVVDSRLALEAHRLCMTAPHPQLARLCGIGLWHGFFEYSVADYPADYTAGPHGVPNTDPLWPCSSLAGNTAHCFSQLFTFLGDRNVTEPPGDWRYEAIRTMATRANDRGLVNNLCLDDAGIAETIKLGCLYGLSSVLFPVFDKIVSARTEADLSAAPSRRRYVRSSEGGLWGADDLNAYDMAIFPGHDANYWQVSTWGPPKIHGDLLFDGGLIPATHTQSTLSAWCTIFVGGAPASGELTDTEWIRWKTCVRGAFDWAAVMTWLSLVEPQETRTRWCPQLLEVPFLSEAQRQESYHLCNRASKPDGQWATWDRDIDSIPELV